MTFNIFDSYNNDLLEIIKLFLPIIGVILGAILGLGIERSKEKNVFNKKREYFFHSLYNLYDSFKYQKKQIEDLIKAFESKNNDKPTFYIVTGFSIKNLNLVSREEIHKIFINSKGESRKNDKNYNISRNIRYNIKLQNDLEFIEFIIDEFRTNSLYVYNLINDKLEKYKQVQGNIRDEYYNLINDFYSYKKPYLYDLVKELEEANKKILEEYENNKLDKNSFYNHYNYQIKNLTNISEKYDQINLLRYCVDAEVIYYELMGTKENYTAIYVRYLENLNNIEKNLGKILWEYQGYLDKTIRTKFIEQYKYCYKSI